MLVKLQRPPPEMRILRPGWALCSRRATRRPRCPATAAHISPAAPAPNTITSNWRGASLIGNVQDSRLTGDVLRANLIVELTAQPDGKLHHPGVSCRAGDAAECGGAEAPVWLTESGCIRHVKQLNAKFHICL